MVYYLKSTTTPAKPFWNSRKMPNDSTVVGLFLPRKSEYPPRSDADISAKNLSIVANSGSSAYGAVSGTPLYSLGFASFTAFQNYIDSALAETDSFTWMIVARMPVGFPTDNNSRPILAASFDTTGVGGLFYFISTGSTAFVRGQVNDNNNLIRAKVLDITTTYMNWALYAMVVSHTSIQVYDLTNNPVSVPLANTGHMLGSKSIAIGSSRSTSFSGGQGDFAGALFANTAYTPQQLADAKAIFASELAPYGINP